MMKLLQWIALFCLGLFALQAKAEGAIVIDTQTINEQHESAAPPGKNHAQVAEPVVAPINADSDENDANRARVLKGGRMSLRQQTAVEKAALSESNKQLGENFLASNKSKHGVVSLPSGVQYKILKAGKGKKPKEGNAVMCRFHGTLIDGTEFEHGSAHAIALNVADLLPGLKEAVVLMPTGSKWQVVVPPQLAYGALGNRGIGPYAVLIYEIEVLEIK